MSEPVRVKVRPVADDQDLSLMPGVRAYVKRTGPNQLELILKKRRRAEVTATITTPFSGKLTAFRRAAVLFMDGVDDIMALITLKGVEYWAMFSIDLVDQGLLESTQAQPATAEDDDDIANLCATLNERDDQASC